MAFYWQATAENQNGEPINFAWIWVPEFPGDTEPGKADSLPAATPGRIHLDIKYSNPGAWWWNRRIEGFNACKIYSPGGGSEIIVRMPDGSAAVELPADAIDGGCVTDAPNAAHKAASIIVPMIISMGVASGVSGVLAANGISVPSVSDLWTPTPADVTAPVDAFAGFDSGTAWSAEGLTQSAQFDSGAGSVLDTGITASKAPAMDWNISEWMYPDQISAGSFNDAPFADPLYQTLDTVPALDYGVDVPYDIGLQSPAQSDPWARMGEIAGATDSGVAEVAARFPGYEVGTGTVPGTSLTDKLIDKVISQGGNTILKTVIGSGGAATQQRVTVPPGTKVVTAAGSSVIVDAMGRAINIAGQTVIRQGNTATVRLPSGKLIPINADGTVPTSGGIGNILAIGAGALLAMKFF